MNIFFLSYDAEECAQMHNNKHVVKMILEYAQLLSTAHRVLDGYQVKTVSKTGRKVTRYIFGDPYLDSVYYAATHVNHPCAIWVRESNSNYTWLCDLFYQLCKEYTFRYGKTHKCESMISALMATPKNIRHGSFIAPPLAMPEDFKIIGNTVKSYRNYYILGKSHIAEWKPRDMPSWYPNMKKVSQFVRSNNADL